MTDQELALEALTDFLNAVEAGIEAARQTIKQKKGLYDMNGIKWVEAEGSRGPYQKSEDANSPDFKALMKDLEAHGGKLQRGGWFYWKFDKATSPTIGRKKRE